MSAAPVVTFNYSAFIAQFPEFAAVSSGMMNGYFAIASSLFANSAANLNGVSGGDINVMTTIMWLATAHVAWLMAPRDLNGNPSSTGAALQAPPGVVGRVSSAGEGSVNVSSEWKGSANSSDEAYWTQTQYGALFWTMTSSVRTALPIMTSTAAQRAGIFSPFLYGRGRFW